MDEPIIINIADAAARSHSRPVSPVAARYDASVTRETDDPAEAYADWRREPRRPTPNPWPLD